MIRRKGGGVQELLRSLGRSEFGLRRMPRNELAAGVKCAEGAGIGGELHMLDLRPPALVLARFRELWVTVVSGSLRGRRGHGGLRPHFDGWGQFGAARA